MKRIGEINYRIRFEGIGSTSVCARTLHEAIGFGEMFERSGKTNVVVSAGNQDGTPLGEFRRRHQN